MHAAVMFVLVGVLFTLNDRLFHFEVIVYKNRISPLVGWIAAKRRSKRGTA